MESLAAVSVAAAYVLLNHISVAAAMGTAVQWGAAVVGAEAKFRPRPNYAGLVASTTIAVGTVVGVGFAAGV